MKLLKFMASQANEVSGRIVGFLKQAFGDRLHSQIIGPNEKNIAEAHCRIYKSMTYQTSSANMSLGNEFKRFSNNGNQMSLVPLALDILGIVHVPQLKRKSNT